MHPHSLITALSALALLLTACVPGFGVSTVMPVDTAVALTLQAIAAASTPVPAETSAQAPTAEPQVLPHHLYFRSRGGGETWQIYRLAPDGRTLQQITFEPMNVDAYDVSPVDGRIAFVTNNQLYTVDALGADRSMLVDGGQINPDNPWTNSVASPVWAPDGRVLAFGYGGLNFIEISTGAITRVFENQIDTSPGFAILRELYAPREYSPDGIRLLLDIGHYEGGTSAVFVPSTNALVRFERSDGSIVCCYKDWTPDGSGVYITSDAFGMFDAGLYHADAATGAVTPLLPGAAPDGTYNFARSAHIGPDNQLYFFFNNLPELPAETRTPLYLVRSAPDGLTGRTQLLPEPLRGINEVLWAPEGDLVIVVAAVTPDEYQGGEARAVFLDGRPAVILSQSAHDLRWGQ